MFEVRAPARVGCLVSGDLRVRVQGAGQLADFSGTAWERRSKVRDGGRCGLPRPSHVEGHALRSAGFEERVQ